MIWLVEGDGPAANRRAARTIAELRNAFASAMNAVTKITVLDVQRYLTQLLTNLPDAPMSTLDEWLPDRWKAAHPDPMPVAEV
jgi:hypothetical protein